MGIEWNDISSKANGGTEQMARRLEASIPAEVLDNFQIILSRVDQLQEDKYRLLWLHDLPEDPAVQHLANEGWKKFHRLIFVSNHQAQRFMERFHIPWSKCTVMLNAIEPLEKAAPPTDDKIKLIYHTTPHRGLNILTAVFNKLVDKFSNLELSVYSSFNLYGWADRDAEFTELIQYCVNHPKINYHGAVSNEEVRKALSSSHIFAYPSTWCETSCLCLMEAMSAGLLCIHPNFGALFETAANWTIMYDFQEEVNKHANVLYGALDNIITHINDQNIQDRLSAQKTYADAFYNWKVREPHWKWLLNNILTSGEGKQLPVSEHVYKIGPR